MIKRSLSMLLAICMLLSLLPADVLAVDSKDKTETVAMYRLYNPNSGEHFYTGSEEERDNLTSLGWNYEGIGWYAPVEGGEHIHRLFNPNNGDHHYSGSQEEIDTLVDLGWQYEGVAWNSAGKHPQYRLFNPNAVSGMHHYTGSTEERDYLVSLGWHYEGISWYGTNPYVDNTFTVRFYDGEKLIDELSAQMGEPLGQIPSVEKSSKEGAILVGYYLDKEFTQPFYAENPVTEDMNVYAKYESMGSTEELNFTSFAQMDQAPTVSFKIQKVSGTVDASNAAVLNIKDGSDPVELAITGSGNTYTVSAVGGFNEGASYELTLADGWIFAGKPDTVRTAAFSIAMAEVENIRMNDGIIYIQDTADIKYNVGGSAYDELTSDLLTEEGGSFNYDTAADLETGDILCVYVGVHPDERNNGSDLLDPAIYVKVASVSGSTVTFQQLADEDQQKLYDIPNNFPILVAALPTETTGQVNLNALDADMYLTMMGPEDGTAEAAKADAGIGDFVTLYISQETIESEASMYYGRITAYDAATGEITFEQVTRQDILDCMDLYADVNIQGDDLITDEEKNELEGQLLKQVQSSGFAEDAAFMLAEMISKTDGFRNNMTVQEYLFTDENGNVLTDEEIEMMNLGGNFELTDDVKLTVELITKGDQLHFNGGVQLAIGVEAEFEVELESGDKIKIDLNATFVQEVVIDPQVKGSIVKKEILWIPVPIGVKVGATIDIQSFTALSFEAEIYTVEEEDKPIWDKVQDIMKNPAEALDLKGLPDGLVAGLNTVGDVMEKIDELEEMAKKAQAANEQYQGYAEDAAALWAQVEASGLTTREDWAEMCDTLHKTSITSDLLDMMNLTEETGLTTEYYEGIDALMDRYCEMVEKETDWVTLVEKEIFTAEVCYFGLVIGVEVNFVVSTDLSLAIGSNLQYQVGKRYEFWFKIGLFKPTAGSSTMDLIDEQFAFQFYVMGRLGVRAGIKAKMYVGIGSGKLASVGITAELGPYIKIYGFFVYENTKYRAANTTNWISSERMAGALFMEFGLYFKLGFEAEALGLFEYSYDFLDVEIPLVTAGDSRYYYMFDYAPAEDEMLLVKDVDNDSTTGITMSLPTEYLSLVYVDLDTARRGYESLAHNKYIYTLSNPNFTYVPETGEISVVVPDGTRYMECDLVATYKYSKMAFSTYDMTVTIPLVWTNLSTAELSEYYTAGVRVGNDSEGYETVWTTRLLKNKEFDLPTADQIKEIISWNDYKYVAGTGYGSQDTTGLTLIENESYDFNLKYKTYSITVTGIQNPDGSTTSKTYYARYGERFDFSDLAATGTRDYTNGVFTKFTELTCSNADIDLTRTINASFADALKAGVTVKANYMDNSITATFTFTGVDHEDITMKVCKGDEPNLAQVEAVADENGLAVKDIYPAVGRMNASATYQVVCGELVGPEATITFEENGGSEAADITKVVGSLIGTMPTPEKTGYTFDGWYLDNETFANKFEEKKVPADGVTLYAKWTANEYTVTFHVNGGDALEEGKQTKTVTFDAPYAELPQPERTGYGFQGWFTAQEEGEAVTAESVVAITEDQTLYAHWVELKEIPSTVFDFGDQEMTTYSRGVTVDPVYTFAAEEGETYKAEDFTFKFMAQGKSEYEEGLPVNAGTYNVTVSRPADNTYSKFEHTYTEVIKINKAVRPEKAIAMETIDAGYTWMKLQLVNMESPAVGLPDIIDGGVYDVSEDAQIIFNVLWADEVVYSSDPVKYVPGNTTGIVFDIPYSSAAFDATITILDPNYEDWTSTNSNSNSFFLLETPTTTWTDEGNYDISWHNAEATEFTISTAQELAGLAYLVNNGTDDFYGDVITLSADIDLRGHKWIPIGFGSKYFRGVFDGANHTVSGMYCYENTTAGVGLFGKIYATAEITLNTDTSAELPYHVSGKICAVTNLVVDDAYVYGYYRVGGIVGYATMQYTGEYAILGSAVDAKCVYIENCVSYAQVHAGTDGDDNSEAGGIVGKIDKWQVVVSNCVNYGNISGSQMRVAGIAGYVCNGRVVNCANYGTITGHSRLGGIVGTNDSVVAEVFNCYNMGKVYSERSNDYIGAICGRNTDDEGTVAPNYYLAGCATGKDGKVRAALGKDGGSVTDGNKGYVASSFTSPETKMASSAGDYAGMTLIDALNKYVTEVSNLTDVTWIAGADGWPMTAGYVPSNLRK